MTLLAAGTTAPAFILHATPDQRVALKEFRGRNVILAFYPADWSPVCSDQLALYNELLDEFARLNAQLLAISVDGVWSHAALARERGIDYACIAVVANWAAGCGPDPDAPISLDEIHAHLAAAVGQVPAIVCALLAV